MKHLYILLFTICPFLSYSQLKSEICDGKFLTAIELEKCQSDSIYKTDIQIKLNFIVDLKSNILPKYRVIRRKLKVADEVKGEIESLSKIYDSVVYAKSWKYEKDSDKKAFFVQPNNYLSTVLSMQILKIYPDVYAMLLNPIHLQLNPKTSKKDIENFKNRVDQLYDKLSPEEVLRLTNTVQNLKIEKSTISNTKNLMLFQGELEDPLRLRYEIVNFLLWKT